MSHGGIEAISRRLDEHRAAVASPQPIDTAAFAHFFEHLTEHELGELQERFNTIEYRDHDIIHRLTQVYELACSRMRPGGMHLDFATWTGRFLEILYKKAGHITGIDINPLNNLMCQYFAYQRGFLDRLTLYQRPAQDVILQPGLATQFEQRFDSITIGGLFNEGFEGSPDDDALLLIASKRALRPGGILVATIADPGINNINRNASRMYAGDLVIHPDDLRYKIEQIFGAATVEVFGQYYYRIRSNGVTIPIGLQVSEEVLPEGHDGLFYQYMRQYLERTPTPRERRRRVELLELVTTNELTPVGHLDPNIHIPAFYTFVATNNDS